MNDIHKKSKSVKDSYEAKLKPMSSAKYKSMLEKSLKDYLQGRLINQEDLKKESERW
jgi:hypothetical protein